MSMRTSWSVLVNSLAVVASWTCGHPRPVNLAVSTSLELNLEIANLAEFHIPLLHQTPGSLLDYLPQNGLILIDDLHTVRDTVQEVEDQAVGLRKDYIKDKELPDDFPLPYLTWGEIEDTLAGKHCIDLGLPVEFDTIPTGSMDISSQFLPGTRFAGHLKPLMEHIDKLTSQGESLTIVSRQSARLQELWKEHHRFT